MRAQTVSLSGRRRKKLERQVEKYLGALRTHRNDYKIHIDLGDTYAELEDIKRGVKSYYGAIKLLRQASNIGKTKNLIIELYEKIVEMAPKEYKAYIELSEEYIAAGQREKAFRFLLTSAKKAYEEEDYELALECYNQAIAKGRTNPHIVERCTELYIKLGRKDEAMQNYVQIGDMYAQEEKNIEALEYYKKACALQPENPELLLKVARMYNAMAWTENAASELVKVGEFYEHNHEYTEALRYYSYSVRLDPENERAQEGRVRINQSPSMDGLIIQDDTAKMTADNGQSDVLEQLDQIDDTLTDSSKDAIAGEIELLPLDATLTLEDADLDTVQGEDADLEMDTIVLDDVMEAELPEIEPPAGDDANAFLLDDSQVVSQEVFSELPEETLLFPSDGANGSEAGPEESTEHELLPIDANQDVNIEAETGANLFVLDEEAEDAEEGDSIAPDIFPLTDAGDMKEDLGETPSNLFFTDDSGDSAESPLIEPSMLPSEDIEEPLDDLQPFLDSETQNFPAEAETLFLSEDRESEYPTESSPFDEDLSTLDTDANALPPATESSAQETTTSSISLEDWIIDLKEDELVELALEEALREQEQEQTANWEELLGLEPSLDDGVYQGTSQRSLQESSSMGMDLGTTGDIIDIQTATDSGEEPSEPVQEEEMAEPIQEEPSDYEQEFEQSEEEIPQDMVIDNESDEAPDTLWIEGTSDEAEMMAPEAETMTPEAEEVLLEEDQFETTTAEATTAEEAEEIGASDTVWLEEASEEALNMYLDEEQDEEDEIVLEIDTGDETLEEFMSNNNGVGAFLNDEELSEEDDKIGVSFIEDAFLENQASPSAEMPEELLEFSEPPQESVEPDEDDESNELVPEDTWIDNETPIEPEETDDISAQSPSFQENVEDLPGTEEDASESVDTEIFQGWDDFTESSPDEVTETLEEPFEQVSDEVAEIVQLFEESADGEILAEDELQRPTTISDISGGTPDLRQRIENLEQQLERTEEEKYFLQERFAAQISQHKAHEESLQREIADVYRDKAELEKQLQVPSEGGVVETQAPSTKVTTDLKGTTFNNDRYDALIDKIDQKKNRIQRHLHSLLKKREESGRFLNQELNVLNTTKQRLQQNLEYIQQVKARVEKKVNTELRQAQEKVKVLAKTSKTLEAQLHAQQQKEQNLRKEFAALQHEKEQLQEEYAEALGEFQQEKTSLEEQLQQISQAKYTVERTLKKKLQMVHRSYQQLKGEYKTVIELKDAQLAENAQRLNEATTKYKKLEKLLADIRKERARLSTRLNEEVAVRESLEEKLTTIEAHVESLDAQESKLVQQLGHELERHFTLEQQVSNKFQVSLEDFEGLLAIQEQEIQALEAI